MIGVILARLQPIHNGHIALIKTACEQCDKVYLFVGSADKINERNPLPIHLRLQLIKEALEESKLSNKVIVTPLDDLSSEDNNSYEWGFYLYSNIVAKIKNSYFTIYYSDGFEIITKWFPGCILRNFVTLHLMARNAVEGGVSATEVRKLIVDKDITTLATKVPKCVIFNFNTIYNLILLQ